MSAERDLVVEAARAWWLSLRPVGWYTNDHLDYPAVNCSGPRETLLANSVAQMVKLEYEPYREQVRVRSARLDGSSE